MVQCLFTGTEALTILKFPNISVSKLKEIGILLEKLKVSKLTLIIFWYLVFMIEAVHRYYQSKRQLLFTDKKPERAENYMTLKNWEMGITIW